jgi:hypothetical protein
MSILYEWLTFDRGRRQGCQGCEILSTVPYQVSSTETEKRWHVVRSRIDEMIKGQSIVVLSTNLEGCTCVIIVSSATLVEKVS